MHTTALSKPLLRAVTAQGTGAGTGAHFPSPSAQACAQHQIFQYPDDFGGGGDKARTGIHTLVRKLGSFSALTAGPPHAPRQRRSSHPGRREGALRPGHRAWPPAPGSLVPRTQESPWPVEGRAVPSMEAQPGAPGLSLGSALCGVSPTAQFPPSLGELSNRHPNWPLARGVQPRRAAPGRAPQCPSPAGSLQGHWNSRPRALPLSLHWALPCGHCFPRVEETPDSK